MPPPIDAPPAAPLPTLTGERLLLRGITGADGPALLAIFGDPEVARFMGIPLLRDDQQVASLLADIEAGRRQRTLLQWGVAPRDGGPLLGTCTLSHIDWRNERAEVGFALATAAWGRGLMREALPLLLDHAFGPLRLHRIEADADPRNERSLRLLERLGFQREGYLRERHLVGGERQDTVLMGLLAAEWQSRSPGSAG